jgi:hypothetical protein
MSVIATGDAPQKILTRCIRPARTLSLKRCFPAWMVAFLLLAVSPLRAQTATFDPTLTVGAGIQGSYDHFEPDHSNGLDQFSLDHARLYLSGDVTKNISVMFNTDYNSTTQNMQILDAVGQFHFGPKFNIWFGRFLEPSDRANLYGPFYSHQWGPYNDGIQDGYNFVYQGRDNGVAYWGDFKAGIAKVKVSAGAFDGDSADGNTSLIWAGRVQIDLWDPENGYYLNGTYYGDNNLLAVAGATQVQSGKTASTADFLMEKKVPGGGALSVESDDGNYGKSQGAYGLAAFLIPKKVGIGKFELLGKYAIAQFTDGLSLAHPSYRQNTTEVNFSYIIQEFDARVMSFYRDQSFSKVNNDNWEAGVGLQLQISKTFGLGSK